MVGQACPNVHRNIVDSDMMTNTTLHVPETANPVSPQASISDPLS